MWKSAFYPRGQQTFTESRQALYSVARPLQSALDLFRQYDVGWHQRKPPLKNRSFLSFNGATVSNKSIDCHHKIMNSVTDTIMKIAPYQNTGRQLVGGFLLLLATGAWAGPITCSPSTVSPGGKLTIKLTQSFPDIAVMTPRKLGGANFFMLNELGSSGLVQSDLLTRQRELVIDVDTAKLDGKNRLFFIAGTYEFVVGKNLETDDGSPVYKCKVIFSGSSRK